MDDDHLERRVVRHLVGAWCGRPLMVTSEMSENGIATCFVVMSLPLQASQPATAPFPAQHDGAGITSVRYQDPDIIAVDSRVRRYVVNSPLKRLHTGTLWSEGPTWRLGQAFVWCEGQGGANYVAV